MQCTDKIKLTEYIEKNMTERRKAHIYAVVEEAKKLAQMYGTDMEKAEIAALFHDLFRGIPVKESNEYVRQLGLDDYYLDNANLAHGKIAALIMERDYQIKDQDMINAVRYHTTGRANMSKLEMIIYLADAIEPNRNYAGIEHIRNVADQDLEQACLLSLKHSIQFIKDKDSLLDRDTVMARDSLIEKISNRKKGEEA